MAFEKTVFAGLDLGSSLDLCRTHNTYLDGLVSGVWLGDLLLCASRGQFLAPAIEVLYSNC